MKADFLYRLAICSALAFSFSACTDPVLTPEPTLTPSPTPEPTPEPTPTPTPTPPQPTPYTGDGVVLIVGGGASGCSAGIQAARMGVKTIIVEESPWLGGMLTSAGVTATDGCYNLRAGTFAEFTDLLAKHYGSYGALQSGWVSNILFEPKIGESVFETLTSREKNLTVVKEARFESLTKLAKGWKVLFTGKDGSQLSYHCDILLDCTELGDVAKAAGVRYRIGMDSPSDFGESAAIGPNNVIQDLTMVMTLKDYGRDVTIEKPEGYDETRYLNCCKNPYNVPNDTGQTLWEPSKMLSYGLTPKKKYMINWPIFGNDWYANIIEMDREQREEAIKEAKLHSLGFLYFIQTRLGYKNLGLADDEYPSEDLFPFYPYHRESRRIYGEYTFTVDEAANTFMNDAYRTGIAVGDYPVDHHHWMYSDWKSIVINFPKIVPFSVPLGCIIPKEVDGLIVAEKSISVSNLINGSTRLQPVVMELGQAAGSLAALSILKEQNPREINIREVQQSLLDSRALIMPYNDCLPGNAYFQAVQHIGATGIMRGYGRTEGWANKCDFRLNDALVWSDLYLDEYYGIPRNISSAKITPNELKALIEQISGETTSIPLSEAGSISRKEAAKYLDQYLAPFSSINIGWDGKILKD